MKPQLLRYEIRCYRASQQRRAVKFGLLASAWLFAGIGFGFLSTHGVLAVAGLFAIAFILGYCMHALTRPLP